MKLLIILGLVSSCAQNPKTFRSIKRECHSHYMQNFSLNTLEAIKICKEELGIRRGKKL